MPARAPAGAAPDGRKDAARVDARRDVLEIPVPGGRLQMTWARALFVIGLALLGLLIVETVLILAIRPEFVLPILRGVAAEMVAGREAGIAVFLEGGVPPALTIQYSFTQDLMTSFLVYPLFLYLLDRYHDRENLVMRRIRRIEEQALRHQRTVQRYGPLALFLFMLIPFMLNGPLVGLMLGRLARVRPHALVAAVVAATFVPAVAWTLFYDTLFAWAETAIPGGPRYITLGVLVLIGTLILGVLAIEQAKVMRARRRARTAAAPHEADRGETGADRG